LRRYYGSVELVENVAVQNVQGSAPAVPLRRGDTGRDVENVQLRLNRISTNYPAIPKIYPTDGFFGEGTEEAVKEFQRVFNLADDGVIGSATWYKIQFVYNAVKKLFTVNSEGLRFTDLPQNYPSDLRLGSTSDGVKVLQYYLEYISTFVPTVTSVAPDGVFGPQTEESVISFQKTYGLTPNGIVTRAVWNAIQNTYYNTLGAVNYQFIEGVTLPYPGRVLALGSRGEDVRALQEYLNYIGNTYSEIPAVSVDADFGTRTEAAVVAFNRLFGIATDEKRVTAITWDAITDIYEDLYLGSLASAGQYPGYVIE
jgi:peptidoglycan hydrolase-like protein with peptidoglycan-binding domain